MSSNIKINTTQEFINSFKGNVSVGTIVATLGYSAVGDGGGAQWEKSATTGQTPSRTPIQLGDSLLNDASGNQWTMLLTNDVEFKTFAEIATLSIGNVYQKFTCRERGNALYITQPSSYSALRGDATLANGVVAKLQLNSLILPEYFGVVGDGITDDTVNFKSGVIRVFLDGGGTITASHGKTYLLDSFSINPKVNIKGPYVYCDPINGTQLNDASAIRLKEGATLTFLEASSLTGFVILKEGMTFPQEAAQVAAWTDTALFVGPQAHGVYFSNLNIVGFNTAIDTDASSNTAQIRCSDINFDCTNGIKLSNILDIASIINCHGWPAGSWGATDFTPIRSGTAYQMEVAGAWNKLDKSFSYGYLRGAVINNCSSVKITGCGFDNTQSNVGSIGLLIEGTSERTVVTDTQTASNSDGMVVNVTAGKLVTFSDCSQWSNLDTSVKILSGNAIISSNASKFSSVGISVASGGSIVNVVGGSFLESHATCGIDNTVSGDFIFVSPETAYINTPTKIIGGSIESTYRFNIGEGLKTVGVAIISALIDFDIPVSGRYEPVSIGNIVGTFKLVDTTTNTDFATGLIPALSTTTTEKNLVLRFTVTGATTGRIYRAVAESNSSFTVEY